MFLWFFLYFFISLCPLTQWSEKIALGLYFLFPLVTSRHISNDFCSQLPQLFEMFIFVLWVKPIGCDVRSNEEMDDQNYVGS